MDQFIKKKFGQQRISILLGLLALASFILYYTAADKVPFGIYLLIIAAPFFLVIISLSALVVYFLLKKKYSFWPIATVFFIVVFASVGTSYHVQYYKPDYYIEIPEAYTGKVYVFLSEMELGDISIDENGIGYMARYCNCELKVRRGEEDISDILNTSNSHELLFVAKDSSRFYAIDLMILDVNEQGDYPNYSRLDFITSALIDTAYLEMVEKEWIDTSLIFKQYYLIRDLGE